MAYEKSSTSRTRLPCTEAHKLHTERISTQQDKCEARGFSWLNVPCHVVGTVTKQAPRIKTVADHITSGYGTLLYTWPLAKECEHTMPPLEPPYSYLVPSSPRSSLKPGRRFHGKWKHSSEESCPIARVAKVTRSERSCVSN